MLLPTQITPSQASPSAMLLPSHVLGAKRWDPGRDLIPEGVGLGTLGGILFLFIKARKKRQNLLG